MKKVQLDTLTGDEFKVLLEQISQDGKINTIPELISFLAEVPQGMTLKEYIESIAGSGTVPADNSVGTEQIKDGAVQMEDLNESVRNKMTNTYDKSNETLILGSLNVVEASTAPTTPGSPIVVEEEP